MNRHTRSNRHTRPNRVIAFLIILAAVAAGCGSTGQTEAGEAASALASEVTTTTEQEPTTTTEQEPTTTTEQEVTTTTEQEVTTTTEQPGPVTLPDITALDPGVTYLTETDVPLSFSVAESDVAPWWSLLFGEWSVSLVLGNLVAGSLEEGPQLSLGVAEPGATRESVVAAMTASAMIFDLQQTEGLFAGRDALILDGVSELSEPVRPRQILTGENSSIEVIGGMGRVIRSHVFSEDDRVFIISVDADPDEIPIVLAEAAPVFESLRIGDDG